MATINPTIVQVAGPNLIRVTWSSVTNADTVTAAIIDRPIADAAYEISGTFGSATVTVQGAVDDAGTFRTMDDADDAAISATDAANGFLGANVYNIIKPGFSGGGGSQSLTVTLLLSLV